MIVSSEYVRTCDCPSVSLSVTADEYRVKNYTIKNSVQFDPEFFNVENHMSIANIYSFRELPANWDSYGASTISPIAISHAAAFIQDIDGMGQSVYFTSPGPDGEVSVELRNGLKSAEFIFYPDESAKVVGLDGLKVVHNGMLYSEISIEDVVRWINE